MYDLYFGHMFGWGIFGGIIMLLFWVVVILLIVWIIKQVSGQNNKDGQSALNILKERYAKGEINKEEFESKKKDII